MHGERGPLSLCSWSFLRFRIPAKRVKKVVGERGGERRLEALGARLR